MNESDAVRDKVLDFSVIRDHLDQILVALQNFIDREWPQRFENVAGARVFFLTMIKVAVNTYESVRFLAADIPKESAPKLEHALSIPPLTRSLLDQLFNVIFLSENLTKRTEWFYKAGWREIKEQYEQYRTEYGDRPEWTSWLAGYSVYLEYTRIDWGITTEEAADPRKTPYWPIPSQMLKHPDLLPATVAFLRYLNAWLYKSLSSDAHLSFPGLAHRGSPLLLTSGSQEREAALRKRKSQAVFTTITLVLALASEMEYLLRFGLTGRLMYVWTILINYWQEADDLYRMRYSVLLAEPHAESAERIPSD